MGKGRASVLLTGKMKSCFLVICHDMTSHIESTLSMNVKGDSFWWASVAGICCAICHRERERESKGVSGIQRIRCLQLWKYVLSPFITGQVGFLFGTINLVFWQIIWNFEQCIWNCENMWCCHLSQVSYLDK